MKNYADFFVSEAAPAVMVLIIEGAKKVISRNFHIPCPVCVEDAIKSYHEDNDWLEHFLGECCEVAVNFYNALEMAGFSRRRTKAGIIVYGLRLQEEEVGD